MRKIVLFFTILSFNLSFSQTVVFLSKKYKLGFKKYNKLSKTFYYTRKKELRDTRI